MMTSHLKKINGKKVINNPTIAFTIPSTLFVYVNPITIGIDEKE
jgi:hypothetical protein